MGEEEEPVKKGYEFTIEVAHADMKQEMQVRARPSRRAIARCCPIADRAPGLAGAIEPVWRRSGLTGRLRRRRRRRCGW